MTPFIFRLGEIPSWPSEVREFAVEMAKGLHTCMLDIFGAITEREIPDHEMRAGEESRVIAGVEIHVLAPEEVELRAFCRFWLDKASDPTVSRPSPNPLSAILALRFGESVLFLGADAIGRNWRAAFERFRKLKLPKAAVLKVPHHGGSDALAVKGTNYLDFCLHSPEERCKAVLLAGDSNHPNERVEKASQSQNRSLLSRQRIKMPSCRGRPRD